MKYTNHERIFEVGDSVTILNSEKEQLIGQTVEVLEVFRYQNGTDLMFKTDSGEEIWIDANDVEYRM